MWKHKVVGLEKGKLVAFGVRFEIVNLRAPADIFALESDPLFSTLHPMHFKHYLHLVVKDLGDYSQLR